MYYDNKSSFYVKQYGPKIALIVFSIVLICSGLYIYYSSVKNTSTNNPSQENIASNEVKDDATLAKELIAKQSAEADTKTKETVTETNSLKEVKDTQEDVISTTLSNGLKSLKTLEKSEAGIVKSVTQDGKVIVKIEDVSYQITLVGIDYSKSASDIIERMNKDLSGKEVNIAFDKLKVKDSNIYAYIYINDELYNKTLLKNGLAILKVERTNTSLLDELLEAQLYARSNSLGIW
jgi:hypothetical protein